MTISIIDIDGTKRHVDLRNCVEYHTTEGMAGKWFVYIQPVGASEDFDLRWQITEETAKTLEAFFSGLSAYTFGGGKQ